MKNKEFETENEVEFPGKKKEEGNTIEKLQGFVERNNKKIIIAILAVVAVVYGVIWFKGDLEEKQKIAREGASLELARVAPYVQNGDWEIALNGDTSKTIRNEEIVGLLDIIENYQDTKPGKDAALYAGECYRNLKEYDKAIQNYEIALNHTDAKVLCGVNAGLGSCYEELGKNEKAISYYEKAADLAITPDTKNRYKIYSAILLEKTNKEKAVNIYRDIIAEGSSPEMVGKAKAGLINLGEEITK